MERPLDEILSDTPAEEAPAETAVETETPTIVDEPSGILRDEKGRFAPKEEKGVEEAPAPAEPVAEAPVPPTEQVQQLPKEEYSALKDERRKRQALEDEVQRLRQQFAQPQPQTQQPADFWENPEAFLQNRDAQLAEQLFQRIEQRQQEQRLEASEQAAKAKYADYPEKFAAFEQAVQLNPRLAQELAFAPDPGEFAYAKGKVALELQRVGSIDELIRAERQKWEAEAMAAIQPVKAPLPSTTAADGSVGARSGPAWSGPTPLKQMLG